MITRVGDVVAVLSDLYPPASAQSWDQVGLVTGGPQDPVSHIHLALDPTHAVISEAASVGADMLITHHPLLLRGVHSLATTSAKGAGVTALIKAGIALYVAHTNADVAVRGVNEALARACGLSDLEPLSFEQEQPMGRVGRLPAQVTLEEFARAVAAGLPSAPVGLRVAGPPDAPVRRVAVAGGAGDGLFGAARAAGVDVYVTADLRHHPALESLEEAEGGPPYLIDAGHWASESCWLPLLAEDLRGALGEQVRITLSALCTDPWTFVVHPLGVDG